MGDFMFDILAGIIIAVLSIIGAVSIIKWLILKLSLPYGSDNRHYAIFLSDENADIELQMALETLEWDSILCNTTAYAVNCGLSDAKDKECKRLCGNSKFIYLTADEFANQMSCISKI